MISNENREVAGFMRQLAKRGFDFDQFNIAAAIGCDYQKESECWMRLANLIDRPAMRDGAE